MGYIICVITLGVTCAKSVIFTLLDTVFYLKRDQDPLRLIAPGYMQATQNITVIRNHFYDIIVAEDAGISLMWDRGTKVYLKIDATYKGD